MWKKFFPIREAGKIQLIREYGQLLSEEYTDTGILVKAAECRRKFMGSLCDAARPVELEKSMGYKVITFEDNKGLFDKYNVRNPLI